MRCYQHIGLKAEARTHLERFTEQVPCRPCPHCGEPTDTKSNVQTYKYEEMFHSDGAHLQEYVLKDGSKVKEIVQCAPWSSGPMGFLCLEDETGKRLFEWTEKEIDGYLGELE